MTSSAQRSIVIFSSSGRSKKRRLTSWVALSQRRVNPVAGDDEEADVLARLLDLGRDPRFAFALSAEERRNIDNGNLLKGHGSALASRKVAEACPFAR